MGVESAFLIDQAVGKGMGGRIYVVVWLNCAGLKEGFPCSVLDREIDPRLVHIALFGDVRMSSTFILNHHRERDVLAGSERVARRPERSDEVRGRRNLRLRGHLGGPAFQTEDIHVEHAVLQKLHHCFGLVWILIILRHDGVCAQPAMGSERAILCAVVDALHRLSAHVAGLAGGHRIFDVERQRRLLGERGVLPLVVERDGTLPFIAVQRLRQRGFVTARAELRGAIEGLHHGCGVTVEVSEYFGIGNLAGDGCAGLIEQHSGHRHGVGAGAAGIHLLDGMADHASHAVLIIGTLDGFAVGQRAGDGGQRIVAALAVAGKSNALFRGEQVDILQVPRRAVCVGVGRLAPLCMSFLMAVPAIGGRRHGSRIDELAGVGGSVRRPERMLFAI